MSTFGEALRRVRERRDGTEGGHGPLDFAERYAKLDAGIARLERAFGVGGASLVEAARARGEAMRKASRFSRCGDCPPNAVCPQRGYCVLRHRSATEAGVAKGRSSPKEGGQALVEAARRRGEQMRKAAEGSPSPGASLAPAPAPATGGAALVAAARRRAEEMGVGGHGAALALCKRLDATDAEHRAVASEGRERAMEALRRAGGGLAKRDSGGPVPVLKADLDVREVEADRRYVGGWASVVEVDGRPVVDRQGDTITEAELEAAAHAFMREHRVGKTMHEGEAAIDYCESVVFTKELQKSLGIDLGRVGWWLGGVVRDPAVWARVKSGELRSLSIGGSAVRSEA